MSVRINTNTEALSAQRHLSATASTFAKSVERLSSGLRINRAADDAAGLAISEKLKSQVTGLNQAHRNAEDGVSMVQTAEGALTEVHSMLQRIRELAVEAANSTLSATDAKSVSTEITALRDEIDRIANSTTFNGQHLLNGELTASQVSGTLSNGYNLPTGGAAVVSVIDVSAAKANTTYTLTSQGGGKVTLTDSAGIGQQVTLNPTIGAAGIESVNFDTMGVKLTVTGVSGKTAANLATDLAAGAPGAPVAAGVSATDLVNGDFLNANDTVTAGGNVTYSSQFGHTHGLDLSGGATPLTATAGPGMPAGTLSVNNYDSSGNLTASMGGETFTGQLPAAVDGAFGSVTLNGDQGHSVTLNYKQAPSGALVDDEAFDIWQASFTFVTGGAGVTVQNMNVAPTAALGTYNFTSTALGTITLNAPGGASQTLTVTDTAANATQTLNFNNLGVSFDVHANGVATFSKEALIGNLTDPSNDTIVVVAGPASPSTLVTGSGEGANLQIGANAPDSLKVVFADARKSAAGYGAWNADITAFESATAAGTGIVAAAKALIAASDTAIGYVSNIRGNLGAVQNRLEHTIGSVSVAAENLNASQSRIRDLDIAAEMVNFTKTQILQQAATAILAQANSAPQNILSLLR